MDLEGVEAEDSGGVVEVIKYKNDANFNFRISFVRQRTWAW